VSSVLGAIQADLVKQAQEELRRDTDPDNETFLVMKGIKASMLDMIADHAQNAKNASSQIKRMQLHDSSDVVRYTRAVSLEGKALKNLAELLGSYEGLFSDDHLPELIVKVMTDADVEDVRKQQRAEEALMSH